MKYKAVIFDLDDTLLRSVEIKWAHHKAVAAQHYGIDLTDDILLEHWGKPVDVLVSELYQYSDTVENMLAANRAMEPQFRKGLFDDSLRFVNALFDEGVHAGIVTSAMGTWACEDLNFHGFDVDKFLFIHGVEETPFHKPDPRVFDPALKQLSGLEIDSSKVLYVGDALVDHLAASGAGMDFIAVTTGLITVEQFHAAGAEHVARSLSEVMEFVG